MRFEQNFLQSFYTILLSYVDNDIKIVWLACEKHSQISPKRQNGKEVGRLFFNILFRFRLLYRTYGFGMYHLSNWENNSGAITDYDTCDHPEYKSSKYA